MTELHAFCAVQCTVHFCALEQLTVPHAPFVGQEMSQFQPMGQLTLLPVPRIVHVVVVKSQCPPHTAGHTIASSRRASAGRVPSTQ